MVFHILQILIKTIIVQSPFHVTAKATELILQTDYILQTECILQTEYILQTLMLENLFYTLKFKFHDSLRIFKKGFKVTR